MSMLNASQTEIRMLSAANGDGERRVMIFFNGSPCLISAVREDYFVDTYMQKFREAQPIALPSDEQLALMRRPDEGQEGEGEEDAGEAGGEEEVEQVGENEEGEEEEEEVKVVKKTKAKPKTAKSKAPKSKPQAKRVKK